jgi:hypothetical protein
MRQPRLFNLAVALAIVIASSMLYPTALQADLCDTWAYDTQYWDLVDANGNCPIGHVNLVGYFEVMCNGTVIQWGTTTGVCERETTYHEYCGDCERP